MTHANPDRRHRNDPIKNLGANRTAKTKRTRADESINAPHARPIEPPADPNKKIDHLADNLDQAENRQEALLDEALEESFPASDPASAKRIT